MENFIILGGETLLVWGSCSFENCLVSFVVAGFFGVQLYYINCSCLLAANTFRQGDLRSRMTNIRSKMSALHGTFKSQRVPFLQNSYPKSCWVNYLQLIYIADYLFLLVLPTIFWYVFYLYKLKIQQPTLHLHERSWPIIATVAVIWYNFFHLPRAQDLVQSSKEGRRFHQSPSWFYYRIYDLQWKGPWNRLWKKQTLFKFRERFSHVRDCDQKI